MDKLVEEVLERLADRMRGLLLSDPDWKGTAAEIEGLLEMAGYEVVTDLKTPATFARSLFLDSPRRLDAVAERVILVKANLSNIEEPYDLVANFLPSIRPRDYDGPVDEKPTENPRPTGNIAKSAAKSAVSAADEALAGLTALFSSKGTETPMPTRLPLGPMIDSPGRYDTLETWQQFLAEIEALPPSIMRNWAIDDAKQAIRSKKEERI